MKLGFLKNLVTSFTNLAKDAITSDVFPNISNVAGDIRSGLKEIKFEETATGKATGELKDVFKDSAKSFAEWGKQLKTGKFYDESKADMASLFEDEEANAEFESAMKDFDSGSDEDKDLFGDVSTEEEGSVDYEKLGNVVETVAEEVVTDIAKTNRDNASFIAGTVSQSGARTTGAIAKSAELNFNAIAALDKRLASIAEAQNKYYASSLELLGEIKQLTKNTAEMQAAQTTDWNADRIEHMFEDGKFNIKMYARELDRKFASDNPILGAVDEYKDLAKMMANPTGLMKMGMGSLIQKIPIIQTLKKIDDNLGDFIEITLNSMANAGGSGRVSDLLRFFGKKSSKSYLNVSAADYKKEKVTSWDNESKLALTVAIPKLLEDIKLLVGEDVSARTGKSIKNILKSEHREQFDYGKGRFVNQLEEKLNIASKHLVGLNNLVHVAESVLAVVPEYREASPLRKREMVIDTAKYLSEAANKGFNFDIATAKGDDILIAAAHVVSRSYTEGTIASVKMSLKADANTYIKNTAKPMAAEDLQYLRHAQAGDRVVAGRKIGTNYEEARRFLEENRQELSKAGLYLELQDQIRKLNASMKPGRKDYGKLMMDVMKGAKQSDAVIKAQKTFRRYESGTDEGSALSMLRSGDFITKGGMLNARFKGAEIDDRFAGVDLENPEMLEAIQRATGTSFWDTLGRSGDVLVDDIARGVSTGLEAIKGDTYTINYSVTKILNMNDEQWAALALDLVCGDPNKIPKGRKEDRKWQKLWKTQKQRERAALKKAIDEGRFTKADLIHHISEQQNTEFFSSLPRPYKMLMYLLINNWTNEVGLILRGKAMKDSSHKVPTAAAAYRRLIQILPEKGRIVLASIFKNFGNDQREFFKQMKVLVNEFDLVFSNQGTVTHDRGVKRSRSLGEIFNIMGRQLSRSFNNASRHSGKIASDLSAQLEGREGSRNFTGGINNDLTSVNTVRSKSYRGNKYQSSAEHLQGYKPYGNGDVWYEDRMGGSATMSAPPSAFTMMYQGLEGRYTGAYADGGFTGIGGKYQPAGIVHRGEYVVPSEVLASKKGSELVGKLENLRVRGFAQGGYGAQGKKAYEAFGFDEDGDWGILSHKGWRPSKNSCIALINRYADRQVKLGQISKKERSTVVDHLRRIANISPQWLLSIIDPGDLDKPIDREAILKQAEEMTSVQSEPYPSHLPRLGVNGTIFGGRMAKNVPQLGLIYSYVGRQVNLGKIDELDRSVAIWTLKQLVMKDPEILTKNGIHQGHLNRSLDIEKLAGYSYEDLETMMSEQLEAKEADRKDRWRKSFNPFKRYSQRAMDKADQIHTSMLGVKQDALVGKDAINDALFGDSTDTAVRWKTFMHRNVKGTAAGGATGAMAGALFMGNPILGALIGGGIGLTEQNEKLRRVLFGERDTDGLYKKLGLVGELSKGIIGGFFGDKAGDAFERHGLEFMNHPMKYILGGKSTAATMGVLGLAGLTMGGVEGALVGSVAGRVFGRQGGIIDRFLYGKRHGDKYEGGLLHMLQGAFTLGVAGPMNTFLFGTDHKKYLVDGEDGFQKYDPKKVRGEFYKNVMKMGVGLGVGGFLGNAIGSMTGIPALSAVAGLGGAALGGLISTPLLAKKIAKPMLKLGAVGAAGLGGYGLGKYAISPLLDAGLPALGAVAGAGALGYGAYRFAKSDLGKKVGGAVTSAVAKIGDLGLRAIKKVGNVARVITGLPWAAAKGILTTFSGDPRLLQGQKLIEAVNKDPNSSIGDKILAGISGQLNEVMSFMSLESITRHNDAEKQRKAIEGTSESSLVSTLLGGGGAGAAGGILSRFFKKHPKLKPIGMAIEKYERRTKQFNVMTQKMRQEFTSVNGMSNKQWKKYRNTNNIEIKDKKEYLESIKAKEGRLAKLQDKMLGKEHVVDEKAGKVFTGETAEVAASNAKKANTLSKLAKAKAYAKFGIGFIIDPIGSVGKIFKSKVFPHLMKHLSSQSRLTKLLTKIGNNPVAKKIPKVGKVITQAAMLSALFVKLFGPGSDGSPLTAEQKKAEFSDSVRAFVFGFFEILVDFAIYGVLTVIFPGFGWIIGLVFDIFISMLGFPTASEMFIKQLNDRTGIIDWFANHLTNFLCNNFKSFRDDPQSNADLQSVVKAEQKALIANPEVLYAADLKEFKESELSRVEKIEFEQRVKERYDDMYKTEVSKRRQMSQNDLDKLRVDARASVLKEYAEERAKKNLKIRASDTPLNSGATLLRTRKDFEPLESGKYPGINFEKKYIDILNSAVEILSHLDFLAKENEFDISEHVTILQTGFRCSLGTDFVKEADGDMPNDALRASPDYWRYKIAQKMQDRIIQLEEEDSSFAGLQPFVKMSHLVFEAIGAPTLKILAEKRRYEASTLGEFNAAVTSALQLEYGTDMYKGAIMFFAKVAFWVFFKQTRFLSYSDIEKRFREANTFGNKSEEDKAVQTERIERKKDRLQKLNAKLAEMRGAEYSVMAGKWLDRFGNESEDPTNPNSVRNQGRTAYAFNAFGGYTGQGRELDTTVSAGDEAIRKYFSGNVQGLYKLDPEFKTRLLAAGKEYYDRFNEKLRVTASFRSHDEQANEFGKYLRNKFNIPGEKADNGAAGIGRSNHEYGTAVDIDTKQLDRLFGTSGEEGKIGARGSIAEKYGLIRPHIAKGRSGKLIETWHMEAAGVNGNAGKSPKALYESEIRPAWVNLREQLNRDLARDTAHPGRHIDDGMFVYNNGRNKNDIKVTTAPIGGGVADMIAKNESWAERGKIDTTPMESPSPVGGSSSAWGQSTAPTTSTAPKTTAPSGGSAPASPAVTVDPVVASAVDNLSAALSSNQALFPDQQLSRAGMVSEQSGYAPMVFR